MNTSTRPAPAAAVLRLARSAASCAWPAFLDRAHAAETSMTGVSRARRQCVFRLGVEPAVPGLHQLAEVMLRDRDGRVFLLSARSGAAREAADDGVGIRVLEEDERDAV